MGTEGGERAGFPQLVLLLALTQLTPLLTAARHSWSQHSLGQRVRGGGRRLTGLEVVASHQAGALDDGGDSRPEGSLGSETCLVRAGLLRHGGTAGAWTGALGTWRICSC